MHQITLLLGSNIGDRIRFLNNALESIQKRIGSIRQTSLLYETKAWGKKDQADFLNQVVVCSTSLSAQEALNVCLYIEQELGRDRKEKWGSRIIDIDILYFDREIIVSKELKVPHPFLHERRFTLIPLVEVLPDYVHPVFNLSNQQLLHRCQDTLEVRLVNHK